MDRIVTVGRRKRSVARVYLSQAGTGQIIVNKKQFDTYFPTELLRIKAFEPFAILEESPGNYDISINVMGGGITGQAEAVRLGVSRALCEVNPEFRPPLKKAGMMTRDARKVERKKYGKKKARKSTQFSKR